MALATLHEVALIVAAGADRFVVAQRKLCQLSSYGDLLAAARSQAEPQRMLFAFARAELPPDAGATERERYAARRGGALMPVMCVDKTLNELGSFEDLVAESRHTGADWDIVFVTSMSGRGGKAPAARKPKHR